MLLTYGGEHAASIMYCLSAKPVIPFGQDSGLVLGRTQRRTEVNQRRRVRIHLHYLRLKRLLIEVISAKYVRTAGLYLSVQAHPGRHADEPGSPETGVEPR
jgi:hypothetical protein